MNAGEIFWLLLMGAVLLWGYFYITRFGKQPTVNHITTGKWSDCRHEWGAVEHIFWATACCAINGRLRCNLEVDHPGQHFAPPFPEASDGD